MASVKGILMTRSFKKKSGINSNVVALITTLNGNLEKYTSLPKLDILYILLFAINIEEITDTLYTKGINSADKLMNNDDVVKLLGRHLDKVISYYATDKADSNDETSNNFFSLYKEIKQTMFLLTDVVPEVDITTSANDDEDSSNIDNVRNSVYLTKDNHLRVRDEVKVDQDCQYDDIYIRDSSTWSLHGVENPLRQSNA